jgi:predicted exporter
LLLCVIGAGLPYSQFLLFVGQHGLDMSLFVEQLFANRISAFFGLDVIVSAVVLWVMIVTEGRRRGVRRLWVPIAASLIVGVSLGLPLFLYMKESRLERERERRNSGPQTVTRRNPTSSHG